MTGLFESGQNQVDAREKTLTLAERGPVATRDVARLLGVSSATAQRTLRALAKEGKLEKKGQGRATCYGLAPLTFHFSLNGLEEDVVFKKLEGHLFPLVNGNPQAMGALHYVVTEMVNNAIDHSQGQSATIQIHKLDKGTRLVISDDGVGIFGKLQRHLQEDSPLVVPVELEKGKLTTDPERHSGEGIFFSSKVVSRFTAESNAVGWIVDNQIEDTAIMNSDVVQGTRITLKLVPPYLALTDVFAAWTDSEDLAFSKTKTTVKLSQQGTNLISRSEAKRILRGLEKFREVIFDFDDVDTVGQGFCDEVFRIFSRNNPGINLSPINMNESIAFMVKRALAKA